MATSKETFYDIITRDVQACPALDDEQKQDVIARLTRIRDEDEAGQILDQEPSSWSLVRERPLSAALVWQDTQEGPEYWSNLDAILYGELTSDQSREVLLAYLEGLQQVVESAEGAIDAEENQLNLPLH